MHHHHHQLIVVGGGLAGTAAAVAAARAGVDVLLLERYNCLGGAAAHALVMPFMPFSSYDPASGSTKQLCGGFFLELQREMNPLLGYPTERYSWEMDEEILKIALNRLCLRYGVHLLLNTSVTAVHREGGRVVGLSALGRSAPLELSADYVIDATGDAEIASLAGCPCKLGREEDSLCQPMTLCFRLSGVDKAQFYAHRGEINPLYKQLKAEGRIRNPREDVLIFENFNDGVLHFNTTRVVRRDPTDPFDVTAAEIEAREQVWELYAFLRDNIPGFERSRILSTALQIGIRESRKVVGEYTLTVDDLKSLARFDDGIAVANYDIDIHSPTGEGTSHYYFGAGEWYEIPYRCLVPRDMENLLVAGRCISASHEAQASFRIMPFCAELGEAAGTAVAHAVRRGTTLRPADMDIQALREDLRAHGFLI